MNCKPNYFFYILIPLFLLSNYSFAQKDTSYTVTDSVVAVDSSNIITDDSPPDTVITKTAFENHSDSIFKWKNSREFGYIVYLDSLLHKQKNLKQDTIDVESGSLTKSKTRTKPKDNSGVNTELNSFPVKIILWSLAIFFIGFILYKLFFKSGLFAKDNSKTNEEVIAEEPEKLSEFSEYNLLINEAESKNDFNLATRYLYLQSLKRLSERELILFSPDKTNNLYVNELSGKTYQQEFRSLTHNYEYIWYGKFIIDNETYRKLKEQFISFNKKV